MCICSLCQNIGIKIDVSRCILRIQNISLLYLLPFESSTKSIFFVTDYDIYVRCPPYLNGYYSHCYAIFSQEAHDDEVSDICADLGGTPVWFSDDDEFNFLESVLDHYEISCYYIGERRTCAVITVLGATNAFSVGCCGNL